jgi:hypothetical protein
MNRPGPRSHRHCSHPAALGTTPREAAGAPRFPGPRPGPAPRTAQALADPLHGHPHPADPDQQHRGDPTQYAVPGERPGAGRPSKIRRQHTGSPLRSYRSQSPADPRPPPGHRRAQANHGAEANPEHRHGPLAPDAHQRPPQEAVDQDPRPADTTHPRVERPHQPAPRRAPAGGSSPQRGPHHSTDLPTGPPRRGPPTDMPTATFPGEGGAGPPVWIHTVTHPGAQPRKTVPRPSLEWPTSPTVRNSPAQRPPTRENPSHQPRRPHPSRRDPSDRANQPTGKRTPHSLPERTGELQRATFTVR